MNYLDNNKEELPPEQGEELLRSLKVRFVKYMNRHDGIERAKVQAKLETNIEKLWPLNEMERTGGEPDVVGHDKKTGEYVFYDCSAESPKGRRRVCYDREGQESRKTRSYAVEEIIQNGFARYRRTAERTITALAAYQLRPVRSR